MHRRQRWAPRPPPRARARSAASSAPRTRISCLCPTRITPAPAPAQSRRPRTRPPAYCRRGSPGSPPADRPVLGGDHPARPVPVHREHRIRHHLPLRDRAGGALTLLGSTPVGAPGGRVSAGPDLPAVRTPDPEPSGTSPTSRIPRRKEHKQHVQDLAPAGLVVRLVASFRTGRITRGLEPKRPPTAIVPGVCART